MASGEGRTAAEAGRAGCTSRVEAGEGLQAALDSPGTEFSPTLPPTAAPA